MASITRKEVVDVLFIVVTTGVGLLCGNPIIGEIVRDIGINWASDLTWQAWPQFRQKLLRESGLPNHDLQRALARAFRLAIAHIEQMWWQTPRGNQMRRSDRNSAYVAGEVFKKLSEDASTFCTPDHAGRDPGNEQTRQFLYGDEAVIRRAISAQLALYLHGQDAQLIAFIEAHLLGEVVFWFGEELKADQPESNRAWRAFQRLLLESIQSGLSSVQAEQQETLRARK